jgi:hypothetical protein
LRVRDQAGQPPAGPPGRRVEGEAAADHDHDPHRGRQLRQRLDQRRADHQVVDAEQPQLDRSQAAPRTGRTDAAT